MTVGARLREERTRLKLSQTDFAALAGAKKGTQISWEKDASSPTAQALVAFAEAGADVLYILTGKRERERLPTDLKIAEDDLADLERDLLEPGWQRLPGECASEAEKRSLQRAPIGLKRFVEIGVECGLPAEMVQRATALLKLTEDPHGLSLYQAADFAQKHKLRESAKADLLQWFAEISYKPNGLVMKSLALMAVEYNVPHRFLVELANEIHADITGFPA